MKHSAADRAAGEALTNGWLVKEEMRQDEDKLPDKFAIHKGSHPIHNFSFGCQVRLGLGVAGGGAFTTGGRWAGCSTSR